ncbi:putative serine/threonine protein kinase [Mycobacteroides abscessus 5S-0422]|uniref:serine/threonine-protein kinase n=1 Tax=Mycobacteroides abscessus TaxID=36809 RepID=UPI0002681F68|nr:serine/threonine-protein kinase [Mycobacteroides abscessus]EIU06413.1 putative serine/threonine protein kinase [Mycobacteroides abscessus 5S-0421]EIU11905.1 putative serine/threonine protein kinase [Mycobacteroides abscessus 5S-0304]EIU19254.1 putative serine/threonine protein kinase [Mycobacteroides abscessus 5S-0422]EIU24280.1 putative serine/threonine protein kinase [Mycobacteroides abscessus 5S-0817]EIU42654.1 putative serine/threonine protein kinase [Mycobacteroides abscessus 5S-1215]
MDSELTPGTQLQLNKDLWTVIGALPGGRGGFGRVYEVRSDQFGATAAAKIVDDAPGATRELQIGDFLAAGEFPNVVAALDHGSHENSLVLVMPLADSNLAEHLHDLGRPLTAAEAAQILTDIATALANIDGQIVHRDLKPENVLRINGTWHLTDFGISRIADATTAPDTRKGSLTAAYAAPEQWRLERATAATDVYAFGVIAYQLITAALPFPGPTVDLYRQQHLHDTPPIPQASPQLRSLIVECMAKSQGARPRASAILRRVQTITTEPQFAAAAALAEVNAQAVQQQSAAMAAASAAQEYANFKRELHQAAQHSFATVVEQLRDTIAASASAATISESRAPRPLMLATLADAKLAVAHPTESGANWTSPFTVISESVITVHRAQPSYGYLGRSHSLWYCDAHEEGRFAWYEMAFMRSPFTPGRPNVEPYHAEAASVHSAFLPIMDVYQLAWPVQEIDPFDESETAFIARWISWFAAAAAGTLEHPTSMPEHSTAGTWRKN